MKEEYSTPLLEVIGDLRNVTSASSGGLISDLIGGVTGDQDSSGSL